MRFQPSNLASDYGASEGHRDAYYAQQMLRVYPQGMSVGNPDDLGFVQALIPLIPVVVGGAVAVEKGVVTKKEKARAEAQRKRKRKRKREQEQLAAEAVVAAAAFEEEERARRAPFIAVGGVLLLGALGAGAWWFLRKKPGAA